MTQTDTAAEQGDGMVCSDDGVVVRIRRREARGEVPAYEYVVGSERDEPVTARIRQPVPEDVPTEDLGFPSACEDHWTVTGGELVAELVVEPDDQVQTVWGVRSDSHPPIDPPSVEAEPLEPDAESTPEADDLQIEAPPDAEIDADANVDAADADADVAPLDDVDAVPSPDDGAAPTHGSPVGDDPGDDVADGDLVAQLVQELEAGAVDDETRAQLADALEFHASDSTNAFVEHTKDKLQRRADQLQTELESLEESVEQLYGVKADANEVATIKRGLADLDDRAVETADLQELRGELERIQSEAAADRDALRDEVEAAADDAAADREDLRDELASLEETAAEAERVDDLAETLDDVRAAVDDLEAELEALEERQQDAIDDLEARHEDGLDALESRYDEELSDLEERHESLGDDLDELAEETASTEDLDRLREEHRAKINAAQSDVAAMESALEEEYTAADEISAEIDQRLHRSLATLVLFGIGATGLLTSLPLALAGSGGAAVTFVLGAAALALWGHMLNSDGESALFERLASLRDAR